MAGLLGDCREEKQGELVLEMVLLLEVEEQLVVAVVVEL